jgi:hypothetical protein
VFGLFTARRRPGITIGLYLLAIGVIAFVVLLFIAIFAALRGL